MVGPNAISVMPQRKRFAPYSLQAVSIVNVANSSLTHAPKSARVNESDQRGVNSVV
jgi:hypothetical protein